MAKQNAQTSSTVRSAGKLSMNDGDLSNDARSLMETIRHDAARIKEQMLDENSSDRTNSALQRSAPQAKEKPSRFSAAHAADFRKMDSIDKHPSASRPLLPRVVSDPARRTSALKRTASKARLDDNDGGKPTSKIPTKRANVAKFSQMDLKKDQPPTQHKESPAVSANTNTPSKRTQIPRASSAFQPKISKVPSMPQQPKADDIKAPSLPGTPKTEAMAKAKPLSSLDTPALKSILRKRQPLFSEASSTAIVEKPHDTDADAARAAAISNNLSSRLLGIEPEGPPSSPRKHVEFSEETEVRSRAEETEEGNQGESEKIAQHEIDSSPSVGRASSVHATPVAGNDGRSMAVDITSDVTYPTLPPVITPTPPLSSPEPEEGPSISVHPSPTARAPEEHKPQQPSRNTRPTNKNIAGVKFSNSTETTPVLPKGTRGPPTPHPRARRSVAGGSVKAYEHGLANKRRHREEPQDENQEAVPGRGAQTTQQPPNPPKRVKVQKTEPALKLPSQNKPTTAAAPSSRQKTTPSAPPLGLKFTADVQPSAPVVFKSGGDGKPNSAMKHIPGLHTSARAASRANSAMPGGTTRSQSNISHPPRTYARRAASQPQRTIRPSTTITTATAKAVNASHAAATAAATHSTVSSSAKKLTSPTLGSTRSSKRDTTPSKPAPSAGGRITRRGGGLTKSRLNELARPKNRRGA